MGKNAEIGSDCLPNEESSRARAAVSRLAPIEQTILLGLANGESSESLAEMLEIPVTTVDARKGAVMCKLSAGSTADAVRIALLAGMDGRLDRTNPR